MCIIKNTRRALLVGLVLRLTALVVVFVLEFQAYLAHLLLIFALVARLVLLGVGVAVHYHRLVVVVGAVERVDRRHVRERALIGNRRRRMRRRRRPLWRKLAEIVPRGRDLLAFVSYRDTCRLVNVMILVKNQRKNTKKFARMEKKSLLCTLKMWRIIRKPLRRCTQG